MKGKQFVKKYKEVKKIKDLKTAKENIENFWNTLFEVLKTEDRVVFQDWGIFERKELKSRKITIPGVGETNTKPKVTIKFRTGKKLSKYINQERVDVNE